MKKEIIKRDKKQKKNEKKTKLKQKSKINKKSTKDELILSENYSYEELKNKLDYFKPENNSEKKIYDQFIDETSDNDLNPILLNIKINEYSPRLLDFFEKDLDCNIKNIRVLFYHLEDIYKKNFDEEFKSNLKRKCFKSYL